MTLLIVTAAMISLLTMAVLALDVVSLYVSKDQAQHAADAAALAGAQALALSGTTSYLPYSPEFQCETGAAGMPTSLATKAVSSEQPKLQDSRRRQRQRNALQVLLTITHRSDATVTRTGLPTFFARIFGPAAGTVSATATAGSLQSFGRPYEPETDTAHSNTRCETMVGFQLQYHYLCKSALLYTSVCNR